ncbi:Uncharacterised protein [uncultured archaeon]|nr:Uncharacterised protein [uncultured archaeon]
MKKIVEDDVEDLGVDECCSIAESMMEEINQISLLERSTLSLGRHKGSLKRTLLRHIKQAKKVAQVG